MAKINIGPSHQRSTTRVSAELFKDSAAEISVGAGYDASRREIRLVEKDAETVSSQLAELKRMMKEFSKAHMDKNVKEAVLKESQAILDTAVKMANERKWYSVSVSGLFEAAKAVGEAASPLVTTATRLLELLLKARV